LHTGEVPEEFYTDLKQINGIDLSYNNLEGTISDRIQAMADASLTAFSVIGPSPILALHACAH
jgi:hypothetical protein